MASESIKVGPYPNPHDFRVLTGERPLVVYNNSISTRLNTEECIELLRLARVGFDLEREQKKELEALLLAKGIEALDRITDAPGLKFFNHSEMEALRFLSSKAKEIQI